MKSTAVSLVVSGMCFGALAWGQGALSLKRGSDRRGISWEKPKSRQAQRAHYLVELAQPPTPEWGAMISEGRSQLQIAWWPVIFPGVMLCWAGVAFSFIAEGMSQRDRDVKS